MKNGPAEMHQYCPPLTGSGGAHQQHKGAADDALLAKPASSGLLFGCKGYSFKWRTW